MLRPLEFVYLLVALAIVVHQMVERKGVFDPVALAAIAFFIGLIPANRADSKASGEDLDSAETLISKLIRAFSRK